jgi:hypothetical protein
MRQSGHPVSPATVKSLAGSIGWRIHPPVRIPKGHRRRDADEQFSFVNGRVQHALTLGHDVFFISVDIVSERMIRCPKDQLQARRRQFIGEHLQECLNGECLCTEANSILLVIEAGGLLGIGNRTLHQYIQVFADTWKKPVGVSLLPNGITRMIAVSSHQDRLQMVRGKKSFGEAEVKISKIFGPCDKNIPHDDAFVPDSWNYTIYPKEENDD